jgi:hypothetical protein
LKGASFRRDGKEGQDCTKQGRSREDGTNFSLVDAKRLVDEERTNTEQVPAGDGLNTKDQRHEVRKVTGYNFIGSGAGVLSHEGMSGFSFVDGL